MLCALASSDASLNASPWDFATSLCGGGIELASWSPRILASIGSGGRKGPEEAPDGSGRAVGPHQLLSLPCSLPRSLWLVLERLLPLSALVPDEVLTGPPRPLVSPRSSRDALADGPRAWEAAAGAFARVPDDAAPGLGCFQDGGGISARFLALAESAFCFGTSRACNRFFEERFAVR